MPGDAPGRHESLLLGVPEMTIRVISSGTSCDIVNSQVFVAPETLSDSGNYLVSVEYSLFIVHTFLKYRFCPECSGQFFVVKLHSGHEISGG